MLPKAYLTERQLEIRRLLSGGLSKAEAGRRLGISRQAVHEVEGIMLKKVESALLHVAEASRVEVRHLDPSRGVLHGWSPATCNHVIITFSERNGVQTWHYEQPDCGLCRWRERCRRRLLEEADERSITLSTEERALSPSRLAQVIFSSIIPGLAE